MSEERYEEERRPLDFDAFEQGMAMGPSVGRTPPEAAQWAINVDPARGDLRNRRGRERVGDQIQGGSSTCYWLGQFRKREIAGTVTRQALHLSGQFLRKLANDVWGIVGTVTVNRLASVRQWVNRMWIGDGVEKSVWDGDTLQPWGHDAPAVATDNGETNAGGNLFEASVYQHAYTLFSTSFGEETDPSTALTRTITSAPVGSTDNLWDVDIPAATIPTRFDKIRSYRTRADAAILEFEAEIAYTGLAISIQVGTRADSDLSADLEFDNDPPGKLKIFTIYDGRFLGVNLDSASVARWSKLTEPWAWPNSNNVPIELDDGDEIQAIFVMHGTSFWMKRYSAHALSPDPIFTYAVSQLPQDVGCLSHFSVVVVGNHAYGYDDRGVWRFNGAQFERLTDHMMDFFDQARRSSQSLEAYAARDPRATRPYYRLILDGPDPRDTSTTRRWWVNILEPSNGLFLYQDWDAKVMTIVEGDKNALNIKEFWSADDKGGVYRHFEDESGNLLYDDQQADGTHAGIEMDWRSQDWAKGESEGVRAIDNKMELDLYIEQERSDAGLAPTLIYTSFLDGIQSDRHTISGFTGGKRTEADMRGLSGTAHRRSSWRIHGTGTFDARVTKLSVDWKRLGMQLRDGSS